MTCHDTRESLSAFLDEALAPEQRREVAAHLEGCADCRRELARLEQTVALLRRVEPARAPVGFVDRVTEAARSRPWYRRAAAAIFVPFSVKLPAEATALVMVALLAVYVFERTPALQESARQEPTARETTREKVAGPTPATDLVGRPARVESPPPRSAESPAAGRKQEQDRRDTGVTAPGLAQPAPASPKPDVAPAPPLAPPRSETAPAPSAPAPPASAGPRVGGELAKEAESRRAENRQPPTESSADAARGAAAASRLAAKRAAPSDVVAAIAVRDRDAAERDLSDLIARVGGRETGRRREEEATVVEAIVPQASYAEFTQGLARLGAWRVEAERPDLPAQVHVILRLQ
ncbi:MAG TPA: zf-HC2 domain-containing protein [Verrucomicrobiae bacterium]|jgi:anti-sigma factor RsiW|nr:zf-HC2 domain-containing protein [Verrucomicrobiae bacterium]